MRPLEARVLAEARSSGPPFVWVTRPPASAAAGDEALIAARVDDHAELEATLDLEGDGHGEEGHAVGVVGGAVERIHDPPVGRRAAARAALLGEDGMVREATPDHLDDEGL